MNSQELSGLNLILPILLMVMIQMIQDIRRPLWWPHARTAPGRPHGLNCATSALGLGVKPIAYFQGQEENFPRSQWLGQGRFFTILCSTECQLPATITWVHLLQVTSHLGGLLVPCSHLASPHLPHLPGKRFFLFFILYFYLNKNRFKFDLNCIS